MLETPKVCCIGCRSKKALIYYTISFTYLLVLSISIYLFISLNSKEVLTVIDYFLESFYIGLIFSCTISSIFFICSACGYSASAS